MCGLVGVFRRERGNRVEQRLLESMNARIAHRGPDDSGYFLDDNLGLGHRRLSVIDISGGHQPMVDEDRGFVIVYNGEAYNYRQIRDEARAGSYLNFATNSDTEVLLKLADLDQFSWLERINGMFAFAIWDGTRRRLLLARDRLGVKPLYYVDLGDEIVFGSEIKALLRHPKVKPGLNRGRVAEYLAFRNLTGSETLFSGIRQLPPGHVMVVSEDDFTLRPQPYWGEGRGRSVADYSDPQQSYEDQLQDLLSDAVRHRLVSDVPVGSFNSGGVDSSLVTAMMRSLTEGELHTFSVGFEDPVYDERRYAQIVSNQLGTRHHAVLVTEREFADAFERTLWHHDEPLNHTNSIQLLLLSEYARQFVTVVLTGEGADEIFGGYPRLQIPLLAGYLSWLPGQVTSAVAKAAQAAGLRRVGKLLAHSRNVREATIMSAALLSPELLVELLPRAEALAHRLDLLSRAQQAFATTTGAMLYFEQRSYLPPLLMRLDKSSMASALECRTPFLDYRLVEWSYKIPDEVKLKPLAGSKLIVKKVAERFLPREIVHRPKSGFGSPLAHWFRNGRGLGRYLDLITDSKSRQRGLVSAAVVDRLVKEHRAGSGDHSEALWALINLEQWQRTFLDSPQHIS